MSIQHSVVLCPFVLTLNFMGEAEQNLPPPKHFMYWLLQKKYSPLFSFKSCATAHCLTANPDNCRQQLVRQLKASWLAPSTLYLY